MAEQVVTSFSPEAIADRYIQDVAARRSTVSRDVLTPFTGGGVGVEPCAAIARALAECDARYEERPVEPAYIGGWQEEMIKFIFEHERSIIQIPRQFGKTHGISVVKTNYIGAGHKSGLAMPTINQGSRLIFRKVKQNLERLAPSFPELQLKSGYGNTNTVANQNEILLETGAGMVTLSSDPESQKEGYTLSFLVFDEAHNTTVKSVDAMAPFIQRARQRGYGRMVLVGVGGAPDSAIEKKKKQGYEFLRLPASEIVKRWPYDNMGRPVAPIFEEAKRTMDPLMYAQHYELLPVAAGLRPMFPELMPELPEGLKQGFVETLISFDPGGAGKNPRDETVMLIGRHYLTTGALEITHCLRLSGMYWREQAKEAVYFVNEVLAENRWHFVSDNSACETNGPGEGLYNALEAIPPFVRINPVYTTDVAPDLEKSYWITELMALAQDRKLAVLDDGLRVELGELMYSRGNDGLYDWPHNDALSSLWVMQTLRQQATGA